MTESVPVDELLADPRPAKRPKDKPPRKTRWLIVGFTLLLAVVVLTLAFFVALLGWHIQTTDDQWCTFLGDITVHRDVTLSLLQEFDHARVQFGCVSKLGDRWHAWCSLTDPRRPRAASGARSA